jgi:hypothetical protein
MESWEPVSLDSLIPWPGVSSQAWALQRAKSCDARGKPETQGGLPAGMRSLAFALLAGLALVALAGCSTPSDSPTGSNDSTSTAGPVLGNGTYQVSADGVPVTISPSTDFVVNVTVTGAAGRSSDHIGAHFGANSTANPSTATYNVTCSHQFSALPGRFQATCRSPSAAGVYHLRGHVRIIDGGQTYNWWSDEKTFTVA